MNLQPYQTPPRWWSPRPSALWMRFWRRLRKRRARREHALHQVDIRGLDHLAAAMQIDGGVLITPNHPSHADPFVLLEAADRLATPFSFMTAWQVFHDTHLVGRRVLRQHGCFSINREGHDIRAVRRGVRILEEASMPLVIFPEGEVFHLNDQVTPFRRGAVQSAVWAAARARHPVAIVPSAIKLHFLADPRPRLAAKMTRLEAAAGCTTPSDAPLVVRIRRLGQLLLADTEREVLGAACQGPLQPRITNLIEAILAGLESRYGSRCPDGPPPERIKRLRQRILKQLESPAAGADRVAASDPQSDLQRVFLATQLYSYRINYLAGDPPVERLAETVEKLEEDLLGVHRSTPAAARRAVLEFGAPLIVGPSGGSAEVVAEITRELQQRVQSMINRLSHFAVDAARPAATPPAAPRFVPSAATEFAAA